MCRIPWGYTSQPTTVKNLLYEADITQLDDRDTVFLFRPSRHRTIWGKLPPRLFRVLLHDVTHRDDELGRAHPTKCHVWY